MKTQHSPGPWEYHWETQEENWAIVINKYGSIIANINTESGPDAVSVPGMRKMPADANARLISAAPDLLEACKQALNLQCFHSDNPTDYETEVGVSLLKAINKAGGAL